MGNVFYVARVLGALHIMCGVCTGIFIIITTVLLWGTYIEKEIESKTPSVLSFILLIFNLAGAIFIPSKEEYLTIVAADAIEQSVWNRASETKDGKTIPEKTVTLLDLILDKEIEKLQSDTSDL